MEATITYSGFSSEKKKLDENLSDTLRKIDAFKELKKGWHYGQGHGPSDEFIKRAKSIAKMVQMEFFCPVDAFPGIEGEIQVTAYPAEYFIEINLLSNGSLELFVENAKQEEILFLGKLTEVELIRHLRIFKYTKLWKSFAFYPQSTLTRNYPDFPASPSEIHLVQEEASPYLMKDAPSISQDPPVDTSKSITDRLVTSPRYIGSSVQVTYRQMLN